MALHAPPLAIQGPRTRVRSESQVLERMACRPEVSWATNVPTHLRGIARLPHASMRPSVLPSILDASFVAAGAPFHPPAMQRTSALPPRGMHRLPRLPRSDTRAVSKQTEFLLHKEEHERRSRTYDAMVLRSHARGLFRDALRVARRWEGGAEEAEYIRKEARRLCRTELPSGNPREVEARIEEGKQRLELALHYNIAYPRLYHKPNSGGMVLERTVDAPKLPGAEDGDEQDDDWEMADATRESLRKARERLARRNEEVRAA